MSELSPHALARLAGALLLITGIFITVLFALQSDQRTRIAHALVDECSKAEGDRSLCYEEKVPALFPRLSVDELFDVVRSIRTQDPSYQFCHVLAHKLGERVVAEDPARWIDAIPLNPADGLCSNGFIHGVVGGRFRAEVLDEETLQRFLPDFRAACEPRGEWSPSDLDRAICYHGLGHLFMFITDADVRRALRVCDAATPAEYRRVCVEGVFMQIYQPLEPDDLLLIERMAEKPTPESVRAYCARYEEDEYEGACLRESWPFFRERIVQGDMEAFCAGQPNGEEETKCYESSIAILGRMSLSDPARAAESCMALPETRRELCFTIVARTVLEEDRDQGAEAVALCERAPQHIARVCLETLAAQTSFFFGGDRARASAFCETLPREVQARCSL